jgi:hypothetical protein
MLVLLSQFIARNVYLSNDIPDEHLRTLVVDTINGKDYCGGVKDYYISLLKRLSTMKGDTWKSKLHLQQAATYLRAMSKALPSRHFFSTVDGRIGLGPPRIMEDDVVCVFYSRAPLYILRLEDGQGAKLIGDDMSTG